MFLDECLYQLSKMLHYERTDSSKGMETNKSKECMICHYWHFKENRYKFEPYVGL